MDIFKKLIKNKAIRFRIIGLFRFVPDKLMLRLQYRLKTGRRLNLRSPRRFTEKMQWYKLFYRDPVMATCADKYTVREYIKEKGLSDLLVEQYAVFDKPEDISLAKLPDKFVLKLSNGSSTNIICRDKSALDEQTVKKKFSDYLKQSQANAGREWVYHQGTPRIVAERLLEDDSHENNSVNDYKIFCYNGKPAYIFCVSDRYTAACNHLVYDTDWNDLHIELEDNDPDLEAPRPENLDEMLAAAARLSEGFPFARVDLYSVSGKVYFGEITFFPWSGYMTFEPDGFDYELGAKLVLPKPGK